MEIPYLKRTPLHVYRHVTSPGNQQAGYWHFRIGVSWSSTIVPISISDDTNREILKTQTRDNGFYDDISFLALTCAWIAELRRRLSNYTAIVKLLRPISFLSGWVRPDHLTSFTMLRRTIVWCYGYTYIIIYIMDNKLIHTFNIILNQWIAYKQ